MFTTNRWPTSYRIVDAGVSLKESGRGREEQERGECALLQGEDECGVCLPTPALCDTDSTVPADGNLPLGSYVR